LAKKFQLKQNYAYTTFVQNQPFYGRNAQILEAAQMRFLRPLLGFTRLDHQRNSDIRQKLEVDNIV
jgi:hypothetical protein